MLPDYFYSFDKMIELPGYNGPRWFDEYSDPAGGDREILSPFELWAKAKRNQQYTEWLGRHRLKPMLMKWQAIRILSDYHSERTKQDWWKEYKDALFRVFLNPINHYDGKGKVKQWYLLAPEESYLTRVYECSKRGHEVPPRESFPFISPNHELAACRMVPCECCQQIWRETSAGKMDHEGSL